MLATIFEVDPTLSNPDDLKTDKAIAAAAKEQYDRDQTGPLTILPCSICYVPLNRFSSQATMSDMHSKADTLTAYDDNRKQILKERLNGSTDVGQVEYIFDLGNWSPSFKGEDGKKYGTMLQILQHPFSVGSVHISTKSDTADGQDKKPMIDPGYYFGDHGKLDVQVMKEGARFLNKVINTKPLAELIRGPASPPPGVIGDDAKLEEWIVDNTIIDWHPVGTCGMGGSGGIKSGVVDERLRVYGVKGLRVIDASVMPLQISAHLQATVYAIAEKGAHMIQEDLRQRV